MFRNIAQKIDSLHVPAGYTVSAGLTTSPVWLEHVTAYMQLGAVTFGVLVGVTTVWLNLVKIRNLKRQGSRADEFQD